MSEARYRKEAMMRLVLQEFISLDGVTQGPGAPDEDTSGGFTRGGWLVPYLDETFIGIVHDWVAKADGYLFGRRTYQNFARDWPNMPDLTDPVAVSLNGLPKHVASNTLTTASWNPTTILSGDVVAHVRALVAQPGRELQIHGSAELGGFLLNAGLIDELRLVVAPVVVGSGRTLFDRINEPIGMQLRNHTSTPGGLLVLTYLRADDPTFDTYDPARHTFQH
jgi:dihydrofolate reductase